jgi:hypothetical protein
MIYQSIKDATGEQQSSSAAHVKLLLKLAIQAVRVTSNVDQGAVDRIWNAQELDKLLSDVKASDDLGSSPAIQSLSQQLAAKLVTGHENTRKKIKAENKKRKVQDEVAQESKKRAKKAKSP